MKIIRNVENGDVTIWAYPPPPYVTISHHFRVPPSPLPRWCPFWTTPNLTWLYFYLYCLMQIFCTLFICFALDGLLQSIRFRMFCSKHLINFGNASLCCCVGILYIKFKLSETFTVINSLTRILLIGTLYKFRTIKCWFTLYLHIYTLGKYKFSFFVYPASLSCVSHSIDICTVAITNIKNMYAVPTNQITDILHFNDNV